MNSFIDPGLAAVVVAVAVLLAGVALSLLTRRCRHPNPHFVKGAVARGASAGPDAATTPAHYECYECGRNWPVRQRDPAWAPTGLVLKFTGYDAAQAERGTVRARLDERQRQRLASGRIAPARQDHIVDLTTRRPA